MSSVITPNSVGSSIPKKMHLIWIGSPLPKHYLSHLVQYNILAPKKNFQVNLWTDRARSLYQSIEGISASNLSHVQVLDIETLKKGSIQFFDKELDRKFWGNIERERIGFSNYAAASDMLRLEILRQEGGYYFDIDLIPNRFLFEKINEYEDFEEEAGQRNTTEAFKTIETPDAPFKFLCYCEEWGVRGEESQTLPEEVSRLGNHAIASTQNHPIIITALRDLIREYEALDKPPFGEQLNAGGFLPTYMDYKRNHSMIGFGGRRGLTIGASGPALLKGAVIDFIENQNIQPEDFYQLAFPLQKIASGYALKMMNQEVVYDQNWLRKPESKRKSFDF